VGILLSATSNKLQNIHLQDTFGKTPQQLAADSHHEDISTILNIL
jgi:hypothetical protein